VPTKPGRRSTPEKFVSFTASRRSNPYSKHMVVTPSEVPPRFALRIGESRGISVSR
jgi:hypothetical protein